MRLYKAGKPGNRYGQMLCSFTCTVIGPLQNYLSKGLHGAGRFVTVCTCTTCADGAEQLTDLYIVKVSSMSCGQASQVLQP